MNIPVNFMERLSLGVLILIGLTACFWNLGLNDIWTPNEGFYADAAREMLASGNFLDIYYNYEPRFNKPPMMYWLIALMGQLFGLNEATVRLPSALAGVGTVYLVYRIGQLLDSRELGIWAALVMAFSFQFTINARYATPEIVLTFFLTLTIFWFLLAYRSRKPGFLWAAYIALGLTILTKGYPYLIVAGGIILLYMLLDSRGQGKVFLKQIAFLRLPLGLPLALLIGMSWIAYMYMTYGEHFESVFLQETYHRAFTRKGSFKPFYYLEASTWGFLPYSPVFFAGLAVLITGRFRQLRTSAALQLGLAWFIAMLLIFTAAKGKIPTYFIQAHPGMSLMTAFFILQAQAHAKNGLRSVWNTAYLAPGLLFTAGGFGLIWKFQTSPFLYLIALLPLVLLFLGFQFKIPWFKLPAFPFTAFGTMYLLFTMTAMPFMERFRPHDEIGRIIRKSVPNSTISVMVEDYQLHNLPFYAARKTWPYSTPEMIRDKQKQGSLLLLIREARAADYGPGEVLWRGLLYEKSETRTLEFLLNCLAQDAGKPSHFTPFVLLYQPEGVLLPL